MYLSTAIFFFNAEQAMCCCCCGLSLTGRIVQHLSLAPPHVLDAGPRHGPCLLPPSCSEECASLPRNSPVVSQLKKNRGNFRHPRPLWGRMGSLRSQEPLEKCKREIKASALSQGERLSQCRDTGTHPYLPHGWDKMQGYRDMGMQGYGDAQMQGHGNARIQGYGDVSPSRQKSLFLPSRFACRPRWAQLRLRAEACGSTAAPPPSAAGCKIKVSQKRHVGIQIL